MARSISNREKRSTLSTMVHLLYGSAYTLVSIAQPMGHPPGENPIPAMIQEAEEFAKTQELAARMDEESGRTTGAGRPPTPPTPKIIFGSRLAGPAARPPPPPDKIRTVEGIKVPPRPDEPDNCCMSYVPFISL